MADKETITVIGMGYVGLTTAVLLANSGFKVYAVDTNKKRLDVIRQGRSFFYDEGLDQLVEKAIKEERLLPADSSSIGIPKSSVIFSCVGTPDNPDGSSNLSYVFSAAKEASKYIRPGSIYAQKSTVPVGTGQEVSKIFRDKKITYISNPEFLREGTALLDSLFFDRIVVGGENKDSVEKIISLYKVIERNRDSIAKIAGIKSDNVRGKYISTNLDSSELIKVTANAFLALKISFANSIAKLADHTGADIVEVMDAVGADRRIGRAFLNAGRGYGGGCFPKDVSGLISSANEHGVEMPIMVAATDVNEGMVGYIANKAKTALGSIKGKKVAVLGLAFKAGTSDARRSPAVKLANILAKEGAAVLAYDPKANYEAREELSPKVKVKQTMDATISGVDVVFIATDWPEFKNLNLKVTKKKMSGSLFVDTMNCLDKENVINNGLQYIGVGRK